MANADGWNSETINNGLDCSGLIDWGSCSSGSSALIPPLLWPDEEDNVHLSNDRRCGFQKTVQSLSLPWTWVCQGMYIHWNPPVFPKHTIKITMAGQLLGQGRRQRRGGSFGHQHRSWSGTTWLWSHRHSEALDLIHGYFEAGCTPITTCRNTGFEATKACKGNMWTVLYQLYINWYDGQLLVLTCFN